MIQQLKSNVMKQQELFLQHLLDCIFLIANLLKRIMHPVTTETREITEKHFFWKMMQEVARIK